MVCFYLDYQLINF